LPAFTLKGGEVSRYVIGGADLMFPGISIPPEGFPSFEAGQPWSVIVPGNPAPIAVSFSELLGTDFAQILSCKIVSVMFKSNICCHHVLHRLGQQL
jgi:predicted ribosome-associated RNA-binding protein Tma20